jgi:TIR domain-containing protein/pentapeptide repeat protein
MAKQLEIKDFQRMLSEHELWILSNFKRGQRADFSECDLSKRSFRNRNVSGAIFYGAILRKANLVNAIFHGAKLRGADLTEAKMFDTVFRRVDLSEVKGLTEVAHVGPSTIGVDTIYRSKGQIPEVFLRGAGVPENFIAYMSSLTAKAFEFYSCFISYSSKDHEFAERVHADLQNKGIRCWFAPEDLKIGDKFRERIDESIRLHDKLLLILSKNSITSNWVEEEVESAMERERQEDRLVLFPIRIDDSVLKTKQPWAASLRRTRHIGDFTEWKNHDPYLKGFDRLTRDLKAETEPRDST